MILECEFCLNAEQFDNKEQAIDWDWNWVEQELKTGETMKTAACPNCPVEFLQKVANSKVDKISFETEEQQTLGEAK